MPCWARGETVRWRDLIWLALSALTQHRLRTVLTTLGVLFGTLVLVVSLSIRKGVQETIVREVEKYAELRRIEVRPKMHPQPGNGAPVKGKMSDARRQRIEKVVREQMSWRREPGPQGRLTPQRVGELAALDHVVGVHPVVNHNGRAFLGDRSEYASFIGIPTESRAGMRDRLLVGDLLGVDDTTGVLATEFLLYRLGVVDEADVPGVVGRELTFEVRIGDQPHAGFLLRLLAGGGGPVRASEESLLGKVLERLPGSLEQMGLTAQEAKTVRGMIALPKRSQAKPEVIRVTYTVRGVLGLPDGKDTRRRSDRLLRYADLFLAPAAAEAFHLRLPDGKANGFAEVVLEVDEMDNVKEVQEAVRGLGLEARSAVEYIEREQFTYVVALTGTSAVALIALLVAAIGITNTMLMSVLERVREIGIMKATGARDGHILLLFLAEGALIGLTGGLLGLASARGFAIPIDAWLRSTVAQRLNVELGGSLFAFPWWLVVGAPAFAVLVTTLAAWYPARRAMHIDPVQALRHE
jgi:putative ABC transport system permease protein